MTLHEYLKSREGKEWTHDDTLEVLYKVGAIERAWAVRCDSEAQGRMLAAVMEAQANNDVRLAAESHNTHIEYLWMRIQGLECVPTQLEGLVEDIRESWHKLQSVCGQLKSKQ